MKDGSNDTICAIATAWGGAIGIIRVSGGEAISIADKIFMPAAKEGKPLKEREANVITFGRIIDKNGEVVDDVLVSLFRKPRSYTGEDSVEISCHGSRYILERVVRQLQVVGADILGVVRVLAAASELSIAQQFGNDAVMWIFTVSDYDKAHVSLAFCFHIGQ